jgi:hypothetical protein
MPTRIDLQRYKKTYPFIRREPRLVFTSTSEQTLAATIEAAVASFGGSDQITYNFTKTFLSAPKVTLTPIGSLANFNVFIVSVSQSQLVLKASVANSDSVHIHAIEVTA